MHAMMAALVVQPPPLVLLLPFTLLLVSVAVGPMLAPHWWERHLPKFSIGFGVIPVGYYLLVLGAGTRLGHVAWEYLSFIIFIGTLFVVAGGIHLRVRGRATPAVNTLFLAIGALLANVAGTTGAAMLLIRPWIRMNKYRFTGLHCAFFIFIVANVGGCLTPISNPPLVLGYLKGVPFFWITPRCLAPWALAVGLILAIFYAVDRWNFTRAPREIRELETAREEFEIQGSRNFLFVALVIASVIAVPAGWREALLMAAAALSYITTPRKVHEANHFSFAPIRELAWLFLGIFATMIPAIDYLAVHASQLGIIEPAHFYWWTGVLSSALDSAPAYLAFLVAALALHGLSIEDPEHVRLFLEQHPMHVIAISIGAVFFGAGTYLGNGPNLVIKAVCEHAKVHTPSFFGYILWFALPVLLPVFALVGWLFFSR